MFKKSLKTLESTSPRPDAIVHLPNEKDIMVDSKVSLTHYERFYAATVEDEKQRALKKHVASVRTHIKGLSAKNYQQVESIQTLDFVLMFVPVDAALTDALREAPGLFEEALSNNIGLVSPSSLMLTLRTIEHIWRSDRQNKNAMEIASRGGKLYDKFVSFIADLEKLGIRIQQTQEAFRGATSKLSSGQGNLIRQAEMLKELGAKTSKSLQISNQLGYELSAEGITEGG
ncbi:DNA recombination protein RmuC [Pseudomonadota bacterium]